MKDKQGVARGKCTISECECTDYVKSKDSTGVRCDYCDHAPAKHSKAMKLGACTNCGECLCYEPEDNGSYDDCEYCDCPAQHHENADKLLLKQRRKKPSATVLQPFSASNTRLPEHYIEEVMAALICMLPGCDRHCSIQPGGQAYDFCSKEHAKAFNDTQKTQDDLTKSSIGQLTNNLASVIIPPSLPPKKKICSNEAS